MKWFETSYRRHLCDMHIDDWNETFLSEFHARDYYENLKRADVKSAMIYFQSHAGHCYYPTKIGHMHPAFRGREHEMRDLTEMCRAGGIDVIGYYSLVFNTWEADAHPSWQMIDAAGLTRRDKGNRYGNCCINNPEYRAFVMKQIDEMAEEFTVDGMFYDMPYWPSVCYCGFCRERTKRELGIDIPGQGSVDFERFDNLRRKWMGEFSLEITEKTKTAMPGVSVEQNYAFAALANAGVCISPLTNDACDYVGGDVATDFTTQSFICKYYRSATHNEPFEFMPYRCMPSLSNHTVTKSRDRLETALSITCAHHGANLLIDAIDPVGTLDSRVYDFIGGLYRKLEAYEPCFSGKMIADVGIFFHYGSKANPRGQKFTNYTSTKNTVKTFQERHIPVGVIASEHMSLLENYRFLILPSPNHLTAEMRRKLIEYVAEGGTLYFSGADEEELVRVLVGGRVVRYTDETRTYLAPKPWAADLIPDYNEKYPLPFDASLPVLEGIEEAEVVATVVLPYSLQGKKQFASIHSDPPGIPTNFPALVIRRYQKGRVIWSAAPIEDVPIVDYRKIMIRMAEKSMGGRPSLTSNAPGMVELTMFEDAARRTVQVNAVTLLDADETITIPPFSVCVAVPEPAKRVLLMPERKEIPFRQKAGRVTFRTRRLHIFDMYEVEY